MHTPRRAYNNISKDTLGFIEYLAHHQMWVSTAKCWQSSVGDAHSRAGPEHYCEVWHQCVQRTQDRSDATVGHHRYGPRADWQPTLCTVISGRD